MDGEQLAEQDVHALLASLSPAEPDQQERRRHPRRGASGNIPAVIRRSGSGSIRGYMKDLSCSGAGVYTQMAVAEGEQVEVSIEVPGKAAIRATCRVASCRLGPDGRHVVGLEFVQIARGGGVGSTAGAGQANALADSTLSPTNAAEHVSAVNDRLNALLTEN